MKLDFLVIGAQKSATTALFKYLESHPKLQLPAGKELPLFHAERHEAEVAEFMAQHYENVSGQLKGKVTPQYMCDEKIPERIYQHNANTKLIAVLRDPIDRAWSHYRMNKRRDNENRDFEVAMTESLQEEVLRRGRLGSAPTHELSYEDEADYYLAWGEYGRILDRYLEFFPAQQLLVVYTSDLQQRPKQTLDKVLRFLGLPAGFRPGCLGEVVHKGGSERLISKQTVSAVRDLWPIKQIWQRVPDKHQGTIRYWFEQFNVKKKDEEMQLSNVTRARLEAHFAKDAIRLAELTRTRPGWA